MEMMLPNWACLQLPGKLKPSFKLVLININWLLVSEPRESWEADGFFNWEAGSTSSGPANLELVDHSLGPPAPR